MLVENIGIAHPNSMIYPCMEYNINV